ncbi:hypothetical protein [Marinomonas shanghaiensis]|jgi:hypothetical protein|uniref:hypothetical protein n=1 Tax=Marinomonas shanghaiensis TaxID=2202418 RepID=UPI003A93BA41
MYVGLLVLVVFHTGEKAMNVSSNMNSSLVNGLSLPKANYSVQEASEPVSAPENDGDSDDFNISQTQISSPTTNLSGQVIGQRISVMA